MSGSLFKHMPRLSFSNKLPRMAWFWCIGKNRAVVSECLKLNSSPHGYIYILWVLKEFDLKSVGLIVSDNRKSSDGGLKWEELSYGKKSILGKRAGLSRWMSKLPEMLMLLTKIYQVFPNVRFIHLIRKPISLRRAIYHLGWITQWVENTSSSLSVFRV